MDIAADGTPPLVTTKDRPNILAIILGIIIFIVIVVLLFKFCPAIIYALGKILLLPFKAIGALFKAIGNAIKRRKEKCAEKCEREIRNEKKRRRRAEERKRKNEPLPDNVWTSDSSQLGHKPVEEMSRDEIESYLDNIDWSDPYWSGGGSK